MSSFPTSGEVAELVESRDLIKILECPVCNGVPYPPIFGCFNGHIVCSSCRPQLRHCALCRQPFQDGRFHVVESIVNATKFYCNFRDSGCDEVILGSNLKNHFSTCKFGPSFEQSKANEDNEPSLIRWIPCSNGRFPANPVEWGRDEHGMPLYVCRSEHAGGMMPGKFSTATMKAYITWNTLEYEKTEYEILSAPAGALAWVHAYLGNTPPSAVHETGETLYVGRWSLSGKFVNGKVQPSHRCCYIPFEGKELANHHYDVLTRPVIIDLT